MAIQFRCSSCNAKLSVASRKIGTHTNCPRCNCQIQVPSQAVETLPPALPPKLAPERDSPSSRLPIAIFAFLAGSLFMFVGMRVNGYLSTPPQALAEMKNSEILQAPRLDAASDLEPVNSNSANGDLDDALASEILGGTRYVEFNAAADAVDQPEADRPPEVAVSSTNHVVQNQIVQSQDASLSDDSDNTVKPSKPKFDRKSSVSQVRALPIQLENYTTEEFVSRLHNVPEVGVDNWTESTNANRIFQLANQVHHPIEAIIRQRPDLRGLPYRLGRACVCSQDRAANLEKIGAVLKRTGSSWAHLQNVSPDVECMIPAVQQILQIESPEVRADIVTIAEKASSAEATLAIAHRAVYDQSPSVRNAAIKSLASQKKEHYVQFLADSIRYPFAPVVENAANTIVSLDLTELVPELRAALEEPDPIDPIPADDRKETLLVRELVRTNHFANCTLCHAPSTQVADKARGLVPRYNEEIPVQYYHAHPTNGRYIRADITYLKQDFSVSEYVQEHGKWPATQRFDYLVRTRELTHQERDNWLKHRADAKLTSPFKSAVIFALRRLHEDDYGDSVEAWKENLEVEDSLVRNEVQVPQWRSTSNSVAQPQSSTKPSKGRSKQNG